MNVKSTCHPTKSNAIKWRKYIGHKERTWNYAKNKNGSTFLWAVQ
jgi:mannose-6-phosphate isomerase class I